MKNDIESFFKQVAGDLNLNPGTYIETSFLSFAPGIFSSVHVSKIKPEKPKAGSKSETHYVAHLDEEGNVKIIWGPGAAREEPKAKGLKTRCKHSKKIAKIIHLLQLIFWRPPFHDFQSSVLSLL